MRYWPVGDYYDNTTRLVGEPDSLSGYDTEPQADAVIQTILLQQSKPHHVTYRVESARDLQALEASGVMV